MMHSNFDDMPEDSKDLEQNKARFIEDLRPLTNKSMKESEELRVVHMFLREATLTPFKHAPNYPRFMDLSMNIFHYVGLERALAQTAERLSQKVSGNALRAAATRILTQCIHQLLRESVCSDREAMMRSKWLLKDYVEELSERKMMQYIEIVCKAKCNGIKNRQYANLKTVEIKIKMQEKKLQGLHD
jgi:hypothetical protein